MNRSRLMDLAQREELVQEREEVAGQWEEALRVWEEALIKKEEELQEQRKRFRATVKRKRSAAGSSRPTRQGPAPHVHQLPDEVLVNIFAQLKLKTIAKVLRVCRRWQGVIKDQYIIKKLVLKGSEVTRKEAQRLIHSAPRLKSLVLCRRSDTIALLDAASNRCTNLLHLSVASCNDGVSLPEALGKVFQSSPHITTLCLTQVKIANRLQFCQKLGAELPHLRKLEFCFVRLSQLELDALVDSFSHNQMEEFRVPCSSCSEETMGKIVQVWGRSLRMLELDAQWLSDSALAQLLGCSELRRLRLNFLRGEGLRVLAPLSHLEELGVCLAFRIEPENYCTFFSESSSSHGLRKLSFQDSLGVDDSVLASIAAHCPQLKELEASSGKVTISGVREVLGRCRQMQDLSFDHRGTSLAHIVAELPQLAPQPRRIRTGRVTGYSLGQATLRRVRAQMPRLEID